MRPYAAATAELDISKVDVKVDPLPDVFLSMCELTDSPRALAMYLRFKYECWMELLDVDYKPTDYEPLFHTCTFAHDYLCSQMLQKYEGFNTGIDTEAAGYAKWLKCEERCAEINALYRKRWEGLSTFPHRVEEVLYHARRKIRTILRSVDDSIIRSQCHFGPGSDLDTVRNQVSGYDKFRTDGSCTPWVIPLYDEIFGQEDSDFRNDYVHNATLCSHSRLAFVLKNAKIKRAIEISPRWNVYLQLGIGGLIEIRLLRVGIDLTTQENNQRAAGRALRDGLATVDLSSASDSSATNFVIDMLAECDSRWIDLLLKSRVPYTYYKGKAHRIEKIAGMGNGYTFPLETLIFYALAYGAMKVNGQSGRMTDLWVYGDDIIVPKESAPLLLETLACVGFLPNQKKTYLDGYFYESCGKDFFLGEMVRPFFVKKKTKTVLDAYVLANQIASFARDTNDPRFANRKVWDIRGHVIRRIPKYLRYYGPPEAGVGVLFSTLDIAHQYLYRKDRTRTWEGYTVKAFVPRQKRYYGRNFRGHLYSKLSGDLDSGNVTYRRGDHYWTLGEVHVATCTDLMLI